MFHGLRTAIYRVDDIERGKEWYTRVLGFGPYFDEPFYVGFEVGGYELGLQPGKGGAEGARVYWGVDGIEGEVERLIALGARSDAEVRDVGEGIRLATVLDPFGNVFGIIENPHFKAR